MKKTHLLLALIAVSILLSGAMAENQTNNTENTTKTTTDANASPNDNPIDGLIPNVNLSDINLSDINLSDVSDKLHNATQTGIEPVDNLTSFLSDASPFLLLIAGILVIVLAGFGRIIGIILIIIALLRLAQMLFF